MLNNEQILLVEDEEDDVLLIQRAFRKSGVKDNVMVVRDGEQAIAYLAGTGEYEDRERFPRPFLVLLDLKLPGKDGFEVLRWIRSQRGLKNLIVVVLSGSNYEDEERIAHELGANTFLVKPCAFHKLVMMIEEHRDSWFPPARPRSSRRSRPKVALFVEAAKCA